MGNTNKTLLGLVLIVVAVGTFFYFKSPRTPEETMNNNQTKQTNPTPEQPTVPDSVVVTVETSMGNFEVTLNGKAAPKTVGNFMKLADEKFYDGLTFHRIVKQPGFHLIQGGDPKGDGTGGPGYTVPAEIGLKHTKGAIATARTSDQINPTKASSGSQFYIVTEDIPFLDGNYTVFGYVTSGMDVVEKINAVQTDVEDRPLTTVKINKVTIKE
jgi:peptidyl-prolyl cis-trans isomerase B (cyclophilin B)